MADLTSGTLGGLDAGVNLGQNYRKTAPSSQFGTRELEFYAVGFPPLEQDYVIPFEVTFLNQQYTELYVGTNGYITFGGSTGNYDFGDDPTMDGAGLPAILISEYDNSMQWMYTSTRGNMGERELRIRYEGTDQAGPGNSAVSGDPNLVWEIVFYEDKPGIMDLILLRDQTIDGTDYVSGITDGTNWVDGRSNRRQSWGVGTTRFDVSGTSATIVSFSKMVNPLGSENMIAYHTFNHDTDGASGLDGEDDWYYQVQSYVWNGSDFAKIVRAIESVTEVYMVGTPQIEMGVAFTIAVPKSNNVAGDRNLSYPNSVLLENLISNAIWANGTGYPNYVIRQDVMPDGIYLT